MVLLVQLAQRVPKAIKVTREIPDPLAKTAQTVLLAQKVQKAIRVIQAQPVRVCKLVVLLQLMLLFQQI
jgi:hypothetical protein